MDPLASHTDLQVGKPVQHDLVDEHGNLLLRKGAVIDSEESIDSLIVRGARLRHETQTMVAPVARHLFAKKSHGSPFEALEHLTEDLKVLSFNPGGIANWVGSLRSVAVSLLDTVERDPDSSIASLFMKSGDCYSIRHQIHSAVLGAIVAKELPISRPDTLSMVCAALTMNIAFLEYQDSLNGRAGGLTEDEREMISKHPLIGEQILLTAGVLDPMWLSCVRHHHETWTGTGYPDRLAGDAIPLVAQVLQTVDMFSARISVRSWGTKELANATMADLLKATAGSLCNPLLVRALIKALGAFPPGSFVQLGNDEIAIVVRRGELATCPIVYSLSSRGLPFGSPVRRDTSQERFTIRCLLPNQAIDTPQRLQSLWGS